MKVVISLFFRFRLALAFFMVFSFFSVSSLLSGADNPNPLDQTFKAHGGISKWQEQHALSYTMVGFPLTPQVAKPNKSTVDLKNRYNRIESDDFVVGFNGEKGWCVPNQEAVGLKPRFFSLGSFYFVGIPFVFADPGVVLEDAGEAMFKGKTYKLVKVGYKTGTGHTSKDDYHIFIDPDTSMLALINHSVTEVPDVERVTWVYNEWQNVDGLLIPSSITFYAGWNPDEPGKGSIYTIENAKFSKVSPDVSIYQPPENAVIDDSPSLH